MKCIHCDRPIHEFDVVCKHCGRPIHEYGGAYENREHKTSNKTINVNVNCRYRILEEVQT